MVDMRRNQGRLRDRGATVRSELKGHEVHVAHDGLTAVDAAVDDRPDVILLDLGMPRLNGYDAARRIRRDVGDEVVLIAITGWGQEEDRRRSQEAGFDHHLIKPVDAAALDALLGAAHRAV